MIARLAPPATLLPALLYAVTYLLTLADALYPHPWLSTFAAAGLLAFVALELPRISTAQRIVGGLLLIGGVAAAWWSGGAIHAANDILEGTRRALPFLVLFAAVMCLQLPALASPSFRRLGETVVVQPPGRRFLMLAFAGHFLGAVLNLAGLQLVASLLDPGMRAGLRRRLTTAAVRGFSAAVLWSPFFVGMGVILTILPEVSWLQLAPYGFALGTTLVLLAWAIDRTTRRRVPASSRDLPRPPAGPAARPLAGVVTVFLALTIPVIGLHEGGDLSIVIALGLIAPPLALLWHLRLTSLQDSDAAQASKSFVSSVFERLPGLRNEAALFLAATVFAVGLSNAIDGNLLSAWLTQLDWPVPLRTAALATTGTLLAGIGVHPVVLVILVGEILTPEVLELPAVAVALLLAVAWGLGTQMSPVSATVMQVGRLLDVSVFRVAWIWNAPYCLPAAALAGLAIALLAG